MQYHGRIPPYSTIILNESIQKRQNKYYIFYLDNSKYKKQIKSMVVEGRKTQGLGKENNRKGDMKENVANVQFHNLGSGYLVVLKYILNYITMICAIFCMFIKTH